MGPWTRSSELGRALACPASAFLPRAPDTTSFAAAFGTSLHLWKAGGVPTSVVSAWLDHQRTPDPRGVLWTGGRHEVALATEDVTGTADWITADGPVPWVDDLKTGQHPGPPSALAQLRWYAGAAFGAEDAIVSITHWPRYPLGSPPTRTAEVVLAVDQRTFLASTRRPDDPGPPRPGTHCRFCRCICPHNPKQERRPT